MMEIAQVAMTLLEQLGVLHRRLRVLPLDRIDPGYFFETSVLGHLTSSAR